MLVKYVAEDTITNRKTNGRGDNDINNMTSTILIIWFRMASKSNNDMLVALYKQAFLCNYTAMLRAISGGCPLNRGHAFDNGKRNLFRGELAR